MSSIFPVMTKQDIFQPLLLDNLYFSYLQHITHDSVRPYSNKVIDIGLSVTEPCLL